MALGIAATEVPGELRPRYNIAPGQAAPVLLAVPDGRRLLHARWGIPKMRSAPSGSPLLINIRAESVLEGRPIGRWLMPRRCAVPASGFYEWGGRGTARRPHYFCRADGRPMVFAGFWTTVAPEDEIAYVIATTRPNEIVAPIHDRMPVILADDRVAEWVDSAGPLPDRTGKWAEPFPSDLMLSWPVSRRVNDVRNDDIGCTAPLPPATGASCGDLFETQS